MGLKRPDELRADTLASFLPEHGRPHAIGIDASFADFIGKPCLKGKAKQIDITVPS